MFGAFQMPTSYAGHSLNDFWITRFVTLLYLKYLFPLLQWHACKLAKHSACIVKCMTTINKFTFYINLHFWDQLM